MSIAEAMKQYEEGSGKENNEDPLKILKLQFVNGEVPEEEYIHEKNILES